MTFYVSLDFQALEIETHCIEQCGAHHFGVETIIGGDFLACSQVECEHAVEERLTPYVVGCQRAIVRRVKEVAL